MVYCGKFVDSESKILDCEWVNYGKSTILTGFWGRPRAGTTVITETRN
ncbi:hypothetical protein [Pseudomonas phage vB_Pae_SG_WM_SEW_P16]